PGRPFYLFTQHPMRALAVGLVWRWRALLAVSQGQVLFIFAGGIFHAVGNDDLGGHLVVHRRDIVMAAAVMEGADHGLMLALCNTKYAALCTSIRTDCSQFHQHAVTMHGVADLRRRNKDVTLKLALGAYGQR